jgi:uncharacterized protein (UPF0261 family)
MSPTVALVGSLDTKGEENEFVKDLLEEAGVTVLLIDTGVLGPAGSAPDISREEVATAGGEPHADLVAGGDRGHALAVMAAGASKIIADLHDAGRIDGAMALGGTGGTSLAAQAFRGLPVGFPKLIVSTAASGNTEQYVRETDLILVPSIVDIAGLNRVLMRILSNAAAAMVGLVTRPADRATEAKPMVAATMFGVTTPCVTHARHLLEELGYEVLVFHMTGSGGRALESLIRDGFFAGVLDVTTTELADHLVGGVFDAGEGRLTAAAAAGVPQAVSVGALDMVNFGAPDTIPEQFRGRKFYEHNSSVTLMRTTPAECRELGAELARKVAASSGPAKVFLPLGGISAIAVEGGPFASPEADAELFDAVRSGLRDSAVELVELDTHVNDPAFAEAMVSYLHSAIQRA